MSEGEQGTVERRRAGIEAQPRWTIVVRTGVAGQPEFVDGGSERYARDAVLIIETENGLTMGRVLRAVARPPHESAPTGRVVRVAHDGDRRAAEQNRIREREAMQFCKERIRAHGLPMKLVGAEIAHSGTRALFFFTSADRVDFRLLVKDLAQRFHTRIEMRQVGVRDASRHVGGTGLCGRDLCCATWLTGFKPISIRMAKDQNLALNNLKLSGLCGRLRCCLDYEAETYRDLRKDLPKVGKRVVTPRGEGRVRDVNVLKRLIRVQLTEGGYAEFPASEVTRPADLQVRAAPPVDEALPTAPEGASATSEERPKRRRRRGRRRRKDSSGPAGQPPPDGGPPPKQD